jgi:hypothetical protein
MRTLPFSFKLRERGGNESLGAAPYNVLVVPAQWQMSMEYSEDNN